MPKQQRIRKRYGLLTFSHGTIYGYRLLKRQIDSADIRSNPSNNQIKQYAKLKSPDDHHNDNNNQKKQNIRFCSNCIVLVYKWIDILQIYLPSIIGILQITPHCYMIVTGKYSFLASVISFSFFLFIFIISIYYYLKFLYKYCWKKEYKYTILDDINLEQIKEEQDDDYDHDGVPLIVGEKKEESESESVSTEKSANKIDLKNYSDKLFNNLLWFMFLVIVYQFAVGVYTFNDIWRHSSNFDIVPMMIFICSAYPFLAVNICFIEIQWMNQLLHNTKLDDDAINKFIKKEDQTCIRLLSSNSSFWFLFGFIINHFPILFFLIKTCITFAVWSGILIEYLDPEYTYDDMVDNDIFGWLGVFLFFAIFYSEPSFSTVLITGFCEYYPPIKNPNIMNVEPVDKPCPTPFLEKVKACLIKIIETVLPFSWLIENILIIGNAFFLLLLFTVWDNVFSDGYYQYSIIGPASISSFVLVSSLQLITAIYAVIGEKCFYYHGDEYFFRNFLCCRRNQRFRGDCCCKCIEIGCTPCCKPFCYCWCCCYCCCIPVIVLSPDYKQRFLNFLETLSLLFKLIHYFTLSDEYDKWYDKALQLLILLSLITLFLMGFASAWRNIQGLEIKSIMNAPTLFTCTYLMAFITTQVLIYGMVVFALFYDLNVVNEISLDYQVPLLTVYIWILSSNQYTKEYKSFTKRVQSDFYDYTELKILKLKYKKELPPTIANLYHMLSCTIIFCFVSIVYYSNKINDLRHTLYDNNYVTFEYGICINHLIFSLLMFIIMTISIYSLSLSPLKVETIKNQQIKKLPTLKSTPTIYDFL